MIKILKLKLLLFLIPIFVLSFLAMPVLAAELYIDTSRNEYGAGNIFIANLKIDVQGECVNAVKADISFSNDLLEAVDFVKSDSILIFWVEEPVIDQARGMVSFAGGVPGGYCGKISQGSDFDNLIGKMVFKAKGENLQKAESKMAEIKFIDSSEVFLNDGLGTKTTLAGQGLRLKITAGTGLTEDEWQREKSGDNIPPETFKVELEKDSLIFDEKYFIVFSAFDKQTGIGRYEVKEGKGQWKEAVSPYLLADQSLKGAIAVKAIDKAGNERLGEVNFSESKYKPQARIPAKLFFALIVLIIGGFWMIKFVNKKLIK
ncbi:MAG: hypothetical protein Q8N37_03635 [bacterium]|nr:hypothetical protein [bacterium]